MSWLIGKDFLLKARSMHKDKDYHNLTLNSNLCETQML